MYGAGIAPSEDARTYACSHLESNRVGRLVVLRDPSILSVPTHTVIDVKLVVQVQLLPSPEEAAALESTLRACNAAANTASQVAFMTRKKTRNSLQPEVYRRLKAEHGLSAQPAVRCVKKVCDAYATLAANIRAGNLGAPVL